MSPWCDVNGFPLLAFHRWISKSMFHNCNNGDILYLTKCIIMKYNKRIGSHRLLISCDRLRFWIMEFKYFYSCRNSFKIISIHAEWYLYCHNRNFCISFHCWYMRWKLEYTHTELNLWLIMLYKSHPKIINLHMWHYWFMYDIIIFPQFFFVLVYPNCPALCKSFTHLHLR